jgi:3-hydroxyisobutyrate dehydrogenase-like beta-hydroxyacid dehydrogenase
VGLPAVGIISMGDMGSALASMLTAGGVEVLTDLTGRSALTRTRAGEASARDAGSLDALVAGCGLLISVLVPAEARALAEDVADAMARTGAHPVYVDANAIAPQTVRYIATLIGDAGAPVVDAGIIGPPPHPGGRRSRIYCSGPDTAPFEALAACGLDIRRVGGAYGQASGLKMVYAASTKGTTAVWTQLLTAAHALGLTDALLAELAASSPVAEELIATVPQMPRRARRWVGEMEEIAATFAALGLTPLVLEGAAETYRQVGRTPLADQTSREPDPPLERVLNTLAAQAQAEREGGVDRGQAPA